jgi:hypothetical protein
MTSVAARSLGVAALAGVLAGAPAASAAAPRPAPSPLHLQVQRVYTLQAARVALLHQRVRIVGVAPTAVGQAARVSVRIGRRTVVRVARTEQADGTFSFELKAHHAGLLRAFGSVPGSARVRSRAVQVIVPSAGPGTRGIRVVFLQHRLRDLHYLVPLSGYYDSGTALAVMAYRKVSRLSRTYTASRQVFQRLALHRGGFPVRYPNHGKHAEANLSRQVLALINPNGNVYWVLTLSSGKPSTPTVLGSFHVYSQTPGYNAEGMLDSNYFIGGYAIHGYADVPPYAASHGCLRIPIRDARLVMRWLRLGDRVDVYR